MGLGLDVELTMRNSSSVGRWRMFPFLRPLNKLASPVLTSCVRTLASVVSLFGSCCVMWVCHIPSSASSRLFMTIPLFRFSFITGIPAPG